MSEFEYSSGFSMIFIYAQDEMSPLLLNILKLLFYS